MICIKNYVGNHKDGNKLNNHLNNMEWVSRSENALHAHRTGLCKRGKIIMQFTSNNISIKEYPSLAEASRQTGITEDNIRRSGKRNLNRSEKFCTAGKYIWKYKT